MPEKGVAGVVLDDRERRLVDLMQSTHPTISVSRVRLEVGDAHIVREGGVVLAIERKTRADLVASLKDGRFHSQRMRLVATFGCDRVAYVVEGGTDWSSHESGAEAGLVMRDSIRVFWSHDTLDTANLIARLARTDIRPRTQPPAPPLVRIARATTSSPTKSLASMLRCVDGVSGSRAEIVAALFGDMANLMEGIRTDPESTLGRIGECRSNKGIRLGSVVAGRIVACLSSTRVAPTSVE